MLYLVFRKVKVSMRHLSLGMHSGRVHFQFSSYRDAVKRGVRVKCGLHTEEPAEKGEGECVAADPNHSCIHAMMGIY